MRGRAANVYGAAIRRQKEELHKELAELDLLEEERELTEGEWAQWWITKQQLDEIYLL